MDKPRIVSVKEGPQAGAVAVEGPPWVVREALEKARTEAAQKVIEEQAKDIIPTAAGPGQELESGRKKGLVGRLFGWILR